MQVESVTLEKIKFAAREAFSRHQWPFVETDIRLIDDIGSNLAIGLSAYVFGERGQDFVIDYPQDWWQAVKDRFAPRWFLKRWPVLYTRHRISPQTIYKNFKISLPRERHHLRFEHLRTDFYDPVAPLSDEEFDRRCMR